MGFINYAHRGASQYAPENTFLSFYLGIHMGANGIETDIQLTKDGIPVLFHDDDLLRVTGHTGTIQDYTFEQLQQIPVKLGTLQDRIPSLEDFLVHFGFRDLTFAIELKKQDTVQPVIDLLRQYHMESKSIITSFDYKSLCQVRKLAPELDTGFLTAQVTDTLLADMKDRGILEICPRGATLNQELVTSYHEKGFRVRAWGVRDPEMMTFLFRAGVDGMTVNFPDKLTELLKR